MTAGFYRDSCGLLLRRCARQVPMVSATLLGQTPTAAKTARPSSNPSFTRLSCSGPDPHHQVSFPASQPAGAAGITAPPAIYRRRLCGREAAQSVPPGRPLGGMVMYAEAATAAGCSVRLPAAERLLLWLLRVLWLLLWLLL